MDLQEYKNLPDYMDASEVEKYCFIILEEASSEIRSDTIAKLQEMRNRQWHTYTVPSAKLQKALKDWLIQNWVSNNNEYLEVVLGVARDFALDKSILEKALSFYPDGWEKDQYRRDLEMSKGDNIDPWWMN